MIELILFLAIFGTLTEKSAQDDTETVFFENTYFNGKAIFL